MRVQGFLVGVMVTALCAGEVAARGAYFRSMPENEIVYGLTSKLSLICGVTDDANNIASFIMELKQNGVVVAKDNYTNLTHPVHTFPNDMEISRNITDTKVEITYTWSNPGDRHIGTFQCNVDGFDGAGNFHVKNFERNITTRDPTVRELWLRIKAEQNVNKIQASKLVELQTGVEAQTQTLRHLHQQLIAATAQLSRALQDARHVERGTVPCGNAATWEPSTKDKTRNKYNTVKFAKTYTTVPEVYVAVNYMNLMVNRPIRYYAYVEAVNTTHVTVGCRQYEMYGGSRIQWMQVDWISLPSMI